MLSKFIQNDDAVARMYTSPPEDVQITDRPRCPNPSQQCIAHLGESVFVRQLNPGTHATRTEDYCLHMVDERLSWIALPGSLNFGSKMNGTVVSLKELCQDILLQCASRALFGSELMDQNPRLA